MAQTRDGALKIAAKKAGVTIEEYRLRVASGEKWCTGCKAWHSSTEFRRDRSRYDGLTAMCAFANSARGKAKYQPKPRPLRGRAIVPARDGDVRQARRRINYFVEAGLMPHPNSLACVDCGHVAGIDGVRHEYDHYAGYTADCHEKVEPVCSACHHAREVRRRSNASA